MTKEIYDSKRWVEFNEQRVEDHFDRYMKLCVDSDDIVDYEPIRWGCASYPPLMEHRQCEECGKVDNDR